VDELATAQVGDLDEHRRAIRVLSEVEKNERYRLLELPDDLFDALLSALSPRKDRSLDAPSPGPERRRTADGDQQGMQGTGTPHFSPPRPASSKGSLHNKRTGSLAEVAEVLGDSKRVAADHYVYALTDYSEVDRSIALVRATQPA
jgi:hypothetical protein